MVYKKKKGAKLIHGLVENWMDDTGEIPEDYEIVTHIISMEDDEFDCYLREEPYDKRKILMDEVIEKQKANEAKHPKTRNFYTKRND